jgi:hypothetical protein
MSDKHKYVVYEIGGVFLSAGMYSLSDLEKLVEVVRKKEQLEHEALQRSIKEIKMEFKGPACN